MAKLFDKLLLPLLHHHEANSLASGHSTILQVARAGHYGAAAINRKESVIVRSLDVAYKVLRAGTITSRMFLPTTYLTGHFL